MAKKYELQIVVELVLWMVKRNDTCRAGRVCAAVRRAEWKRQVNTGRAVNTLRGWNNL